MNPEGSFDYLQKKDYRGAVTFTYRAADYMLESNIAMVTISVGMKVYLPTITH